MIILSWLLPVKFVFDFRSQLQKNVFIRLGIVTPQFALVPQCQVNHGKIHDFLVALASLEIGKVSIEQFIDEFCSLTIESLVFSGNTHADFGIVYVQPYVYFA